MTVPCHGRDDLSICLDATPDPLETCAIEVTSDELGSAPSWKRDSDLLAFLTSL